MVVLRLFLRYLALVAKDLSWDDFRARIHELAPEVEQEVMTAAEQLIKKGFAKGIDKGIAEGRSGLLTRQLVLRFGELPESYRVRLATASVDQLDAWGDRVLTATTLDQVFEHR